MLKKTITYENLDGETTSEDFYFNLTKAELAEMELSYDGGFGEYLRKIVDAKSGRQIITAFKEIVGKAYGERSEDGKRFLKSEDRTNEFLSSEAWSELFMELISEPKAGADFVNAIIPQSMVNEVQAQVQPTSLNPIEDVDINALKARLAELESGQVTKAVSPFER